jgi:hypothetical protein
MIIFPSKKEFIYLSGVLRPPHLGVLKMVEFMVILVESIYKLKQIMFNTGTLKIESIQFDAF